MLKQIPVMVDNLSAKVAQRTALFTETKIGKLFLSIVLLGPLTFLPTMYEAWTAPNIDALRTLTWPLMIVINFSAFLAVIHNGDWRMRLVMLIWIISMAIVWIATLVR